MERWSLSYTRKASAGLLPESSLYPIARLGDVIADLENGWSPECYERPAEPGEWGVLKLGAVSFGEFNAQENKALPPTLVPIPALEVRPGQVLISRANVERYVGACAVVRETRSRLMLSDKIFRVIFRADEPLDGEFLSEILKTPHLRRQIECALTGSSATMQNITKESLLNLRLPLPPLEIQRQLVARIAEIRAAVAAERAAADRRETDIAAEIEALILGTQRLPAD